MQEITTIGLDLAKHIFQVHGVDGAGRVVVRKAVRRNKLLAFFADLPPCLVGMEACGSAHHWARELIALGHEVKLMPPRYVKAYLKRGKNDAADAEAICEAVTRPTMRFVPVKSVDQQTVLMLHRTRDMLMRQKTATSNAFRSQQSELGHIAARGAKGLAELVAEIDAETSSLPPLSLVALAPLVRIIGELDAAIKTLERELVIWHRSNADSLRLATIPNVGVLTATAMVASIGDPARFASGRQLAAWLGLVPRQDSTGGKQRLGSITKMGDGYLRRLLVLGATSGIRAARNRSDAAARWVNTLLARRKPRVVSIALANKTARIIWAVLAHGGVYCKPAAA